MDGCILASDYPTKRMILHGARVLGMLPLHPTPPQSELVPWETAISRSVQADPVSE